MSQPPPIPVQPLAYGMPSPGRPGVVTAIGVISIVLGSLGLLGMCTGLLFSSFLVGAAASRSATVSGSSSTNITINGGASGGSSNISTSSSTNTGAPPAPTPAATATADGLAALEPITPQQREQLLALIADRGDAYLGGPNDTGGWTAADMQKLIRTHGRLTASPGEAHPGYFFTLDDGRLEIHDDYATYHPKSGDPFTLRASRQPGAYSVTTTQGGNSSSTSMKFSGPIPPFTPLLSKGYMGFEMAMSIAGTILGLLLIIAGAMLLRGSAIGRRLHLIYAFIKLPLAIGGAVVGSIMVSSMFSGASTGAMPPGMNYFVTAFAVMGALIPAIYPIVLLIVMQTRSVKEWVGIIS
jgi:hypothetical protein